MGVYWVGSGLATGLGGCLWYVVRSVVIPGLLGYLAVVEPSLLSFWPGMYGLLGLLGGGGGWGRLLVGVGLGGGR